MIYNYEMDWLTYWLTDSLTNYMEQSPSWEANGHSASQEITHLLWNPKVHYHARSSLLSEALCNSVTFHNKRIIKVRSC